MITLEESSVRQKLKGNLLRNEVQSIENELSTLQEAQAQVEELKSQIAQLELGHEKLHETLSENIKLQSQVQELQSKPDEHPADTIEFGQLNNQLAEQKSCTLQNITWIKHLESNFPGKS